MIPVLLALLCSIPLLGAGEAGWVWIEGEAAAEHTFTQQAFDAGQYGARREGLSGGQWLSTGGKVPEGGHRLRWQVAVAQAGEYQFWARKFWKHGPFRWRFGDGAWHEAGRDLGLIDGYELATHIGANWVALGSVTLAAGAQDLHVELTAKPGEDCPAAFDCFALDRTGWTPAGKLKPGESDTRAEPGWWAFAPPADRFAEAALDLRSLNEKRAGEKGPLKADGDVLRYADGRPARFWAVNVGPGMIEQAPAQVQYLARRLAKVGVNMVRIHGGVWDAALAPKADYIGRLQQAVAAFRDQGIYVHLSFYFPLWVDAGKSGLAGYSGDGKHPFALTYIDPAFEERWRGWAKALLGSPDPHAGGVPLAKNPAVGIIELVNEDSLFFWTFGEKNIPAPYWETLELRFAAWLGKRHGSVDKALAQWPAAKQARDSAARVQVLDAWHMTGDGVKEGGDKLKRMREQVRFLAELQRGFHERSISWLRQDLGATCPVSPGNWTTTDPARLDVVERWTYAAGEVLDRHAYYGPESKKRQRSWTVTVGDVLAPRSALLAPAGLPVANSTWAGKAHIVTETAWTTINRFVAEESPLWSAYASLQGIDGVFFFALGTPGWATTASDLGVASPACLGQSPAFALLYRRGDVAEGPVVASQALSVDDVVSLTGRATGEGQNIDEFRAKEVGKAGAAAAGIDPLASYVGRVVRGVDPVPPKATADAAKGIDRAAKVVTSATGELRWDWDAGIMRIDAAKAQAVTGFLAKGTEFKLGDVAIRCGNEYGTVAVISLDGLPLKSSRRMLVQAFTEQRILGFRQDPDGTIRDFGNGPINVRAIDATVTFAGTAPRKATVCDGHGYARGEAKLAGNALSLPADALYTIVER